MARLRSCSWYELHNAILRSQAVLSNNSKNFSSEALAPINHKYTMNLLPSFFVVAPAIFVDAPANFLVTIANCVIATAIFIVGPSIYIDTSVDFVVTPAKQY